jgi:hypothetical protein
VNLKIMGIIRDLGLSVAFPTRSIHVESLPRQMLSGSEMPDDGRGDKSDEA